MKPLLKIPLVVQVAASLRRAIEEREFTDSLPGVRSLSREMRVSIPTLKEAMQILKNEGVLLIQHGCKTRIISSPRGEMKRSLGSKRVVFLSFSPENVSESLFYRDIIDELQASEVETVIHQFGKKSWRLLQAELEQLAMKHRSNCWVLVGGTTKVQEFLAKKRLPCVVASGTASRGLAIPDIEIDFAALYRHAVNKLLNLGHRRIALIISEASHQRNPKTVEVFLDTAQNCLPKMQPRGLVMTYDGAKPERLKRMLAKIYGMPNAPTGLIVCHFSALLTVMSWLSKHGRRIPRDVSLICRDFSPMIDYLDPVPSHYRYNVHQRSRKLMRIVLSMLDKKVPKGPTLLLPDFVRGETLASIALL